MKVGEKEWEAQVHLPRRWGVGYLSSSRFALSDVMAASGAAPTVAVPWLSYVVGFPQFRHWSPAALPSSRTEEKIHTDGGGIDNAGVIPLLRRRVGTIITFVNTQMGFDKAGKPEFPDYVGALFGRPQAGYAAQKCQVFPYNDLESLSGEFMERWDADKPLIVERQYKTVANEGYGIASGHQVKVVWVFLGGGRDAARLAENLGTPEAAAAEAVAVKRGTEGSLRRWMGKMPKESREMVLSPEFKRFPYYRTFFENGPYILKLPVAKVNALAHFTSYNVMATQGIFERAVAEAR